MSLRHKPLHSKRERVPESQAIEPLEDHVSSYTTRYYNRGSNPIQRKYSRLLLKSEKLQIPSLTTFRSLPFVTSKVNAIGYLRNSLITFRNQMQATRSLKAKLRVLAPTRLRE